MEFSFYLYCCKFCLVLEGSSRSIPLELSNSTEELGLVAAFAPNECGVVIQHVDSQTRRLLVAPGRDTVTTWINVFVEETCDERCDCNF